MADDYGYGDYASYDPYANNGSYYDSFTQGGGYDNYNNGYSQPDPSVYGGGYSTRNQQLQTTYDQNGNLVFSGQGNPAQYSGDQMPGSYSVETQRPNNPSSYSLFDPRNPMASQFPTMRSGQMSNDTSGGGSVQRQPYQPTDQINNITGPYPPAAMGFMKQVGWQPPTQDKMPTDLYNLYSNFLKDPSNINSNPMYAEMMRAGTQATERAQLARGNQGSGNILAELQKTGMGIAGDYIPKMSNIYNAGSQEEAGRWKQQQGINLQTGQLGLNAYNTESQDQFQRALQTIGGRNQVTNNNAIVPNANMSNQLAQTLTMRSMGGF